MGLISRVSSRTYRDMSANVSVESRIKKINEIENNVATALNLLSVSLAELAKDKPNDRIADQNSTKFLSTLDIIENNELAEVTAQVSARLDHVNGLCKTILES